MITKAEVEKAQKAWGDGVIHIGTLKDNPQECQKAAEHHVDTFYAYESGTVLFKPTLAAEKQFRGTREAALSYFIGGNSSFPEDKGFAIKPWTKVRFENTDVILDENRAFAMGNYFFTDTNGDITKVEYTFGYKKNAAGELKIDIHHSSLPYSS